MGSSTQQAAAAHAPVGMFAPLATRSFRNIWLASLVSNTGFLIQGVGSAWAMTSMASADMVAMVQTASFLPIALLAVPAGALADMYDRRKAQIWALSLAMAGAAAMTLVSAAGWLTPWSLLFFCFLIGCGVAMFSPAWQSSASEHVSHRLLPQAVALNSVSFNIARSVGPAIGGFIVAAVGATAAFAANALCYVPLWLALLGWKREVEPSRLPPERLGWAMLSGVRYIVHMQPVRTAIVRSLVFGLVSSSILSLLPLIARDLVSGTAATFGVMLGAFGIGAVAGIFVLQRSRRYASEQVFRVFTVLFGASALALSFSHHLLVSCALLFCTGMGWMVILTTVNIALQMFVPRWVTGRAIAALNASNSAGIAFGSWCWGMLAERHGVGEALLVSGAVLMVTPLLGLLLPIQDRGVSDDEEPRLLADPDVRLGINGRSGPIMIELKYHIAEDCARDFYNLMQDVRRIRSRNGAYDWSLSRDIGDPALWVERYRCPTWNDYLRLRNRGTSEERAVQLAAMNMHIGMAPVEVRRQLERPFGSVRWRAESPDPGQDYPS